ncbi:MAG: DUF5113 domain-containing protein [Bacteroidaceae bacterium]|nr:DUF5113 domain-containing protein [Bacteroidaceae bacterium]
MRNSLCLTLVCLLGLLAACGNPAGQSQTEVIDSLNARAYRYRYIDIDSVERLSEESYRRSVDYPDGRDEARLNLAFVAYQRMDFDRVDSVLGQLRHDTRNDLLLLCADVMQMKASQRTGDGERFFQVKGLAEERMQHLSAREARLSPHEIALWVYAQSEYHLIASTYYFYQEQDSLARTELRHVLPALQLHVDTAQWVYYNYMLGPGGLVEGRDASDVTLQEFDYLFRAYTTSRRNGFRYFEANCLQAFASMFLTNDSLIRENRSDEYHLLRFQHMLREDKPETFLPLAFARHALTLFEEYDDLFQTACTYRTLGEICFYRGDYDLSLKNYAKALHCVNLHHLRYYGVVSPDTLSAFRPDDLERSVEQEWIDNPRISTVPEWIAGIRQQLSLTYSALGEKQASDYNRNFYLDLLQATNQNQELESRTEELERQTRSLRNRMVLCVVLLVVALLLAYLVRRMLKRRVRTSLQELEDEQWQPYRDFVNWRTQTLAELEDEREEGEELLQVCRRRVTDDKRKNAENRAKVSLVHAIVPFLDRIGGEVMRMNQEGKVSPERREYIVELVDEIDRCNAILTEWIRMEQGQLSLHLSTVDLNRLFSIIADGHYAFDQKHVSLQVQPTGAYVKADESLTLFMVNTLCDNARKFTPEGGTVTLSAEAAEEYVEVRVTDTGCGLSDEEVDTLMHSKVYDAKEIGPKNEGKGFGFGLMNCRGIIEKYKKTSAIFSCCDFGVSSKLGQGSTFYFRLPRVVRAALLMLLFPLLCQAGAETQYYDSLFLANVEGDYEEAVRLAQKTLDALNQSHPGMPQMCLVDSAGNEPAEMRWAKEGVEADYELIVGLRNEMSLAALALNDWQMYQYNNRACIRLHKYLHQDKSLPTYYRRLERTHRNSNYLLLLIIGVSVVILAFAVRLLVGLQLYKKREIDELKNYCLALFRMAQKRPLHETFLSATSTYPEMRKQAIGYQRQVAQESVLPVNRLQDEIGRLADERARLEFEQNRLYIQNQILDNCLSTIKHESMYYPSRIRLLTEKMGDDDIEQLSELVRYYRHVYSLLCRQADEQVGEPGFKRQHLQVAPLLQEAKAIAERYLKRQGNEAEVNIVDHISEPLSVLADETLLQVLFDSLLSGMVQGQTRLTIEASREENFVRFTLRDSASALSAEQLANLFFPDSSRISYLVAKQIIREHDTYANHPGLRLVAQPSADGGYEIFFTLMVKA